MNRTEFHLIGMFFSMQTKVLMGFATKYGSTQEVAEAIAATFHEKGLLVDLKQVRDVKTLDEYNAVVLGVPLYMLKWHKEATIFFQDTGKL